MNIEITETPQMRFVNPDTGFESDAVKAKKFLVLDAVYTVSRIRGDGSFIGVWFDEIPNQRFNLKMFEPVHN